MKYHIESYHIIYILYIFIKSKTEIFEKVEHLRRTEKEFVQLAESLIVSMPDTSTAEDLGGSLDFIFHFNFPLH